jgi:HEAT repeat protein
MAGSEDRTDMMKKRITRLAAGLIIGLAGMVLGVWVMSKELAMRETLYHGNPRDYWIAQVNAPDAAARNQANAILNAEIIPHLTDVMFHDTHDSTLKLALVSGLDGLPGISVPFMPAHDRRKSAAIELGRYGPAASNAVPALLQALNSGDDAVREGAATSLSGIHAEPEVVIPALIKCLDDDDVNVRAAGALGGFGPAARAAVPQLIQLLHANDGETQFAAAAALKKIDPVAYARARNAEQGAASNAGPIKAEATGTTGVK